MMAAKQGSSLITIIIFVLGVIRERSLAERGGVCVIAAVRGRQVNNSICGRDLGRSMRRHLWHQLNSLSMLAVLTLSCIIKAHHTFACMGGKGLTGIQVVCFRSDY